MIHLGQQPFCRIEMVRNGGVSRLCRQWPVTIDSNVASCFAGTMDVQTKYSQQNQGHGGQSSRRPRPTPSQKFKAAGAFRCQHTEVVAKPLPVTLQVRLWNRVGGEYTQRLRNRLRK